MQLTLKQLRAFVLVAETSKFTAAAERLFITQSALSTLIKELEQAVGVRLFDRHTRLVQLTVAGQELLGVAQRALSDIDGAVQDLRSLASLQRGRVRVVASTVIASGLLADAFRTFRDQHPDIALDLRDVAEEQIMGIVQSGSVDFGIGTTLGEHEGVQARHLFDDRFLALCPLDHPFATRSKIAWKELAHQPFIALNPASPIRQQIDATLARQGLELSIVHQVSFSTTVLSLVRAGLGVSVLPMNNHPYVPAFQVHAATLVAPVVKRDISVLTPSHKSLSPAAQAFADLCAQYGRTLARAHPSPHRSGDGR